MTSQINTYTGMLQRRSTDGQLKVNYLKENAQTFSVAKVAEAGAATESTFNVAEASVDLRKLATYMPFSAEELRSRNDFVGFLTTRIVRAVANELESQLISGTNVAPQLLGLEVHVPEGTTGLSAGDVGLDVIEENISKTENVGGQQVTAILMEKTGITAMRTWHVNPGAANAPPVDARYVIGDPRQRGPLVLWDVPVVRVPSLSDGVVFTVDSMPIVLYDRGESMEVRFSDSHAANFISDVWVAVCSTWAQQEFTRFAPAVGSGTKTAAAYIRRISDFASAGS